MKTALIFRRAWVLILQTGFLGFALLPFSLAVAIAEELGPWWLYSLAIIGSWFVAFVLLQAYRAAEVDLKLFENRYNDVPVPRIARRSLGRKGKYHGIYHKTRPGRGAKSNRKVV